MNSSTVPPRLGCRNTAVPVGDNAVRMTHRRSSWKSLKNKQSAPRTKSNSLAAEDRDASDSMVVGDCTLLTGRLSRMPCNCRSGSPRRHKSCLASTSGVRKEAFCWFIRIHISCVRAHGSQQLQFMDEYCYWTSGRARWMHVTILNKSQRMQSSACFTLKISQHTHLIANTIHMSVRQHYRRTFQSRCDS